MVRISLVLTILTYAVSLLGVIPVFPYIDMVPRVLFVAAFAAGCLFDRKGRYPLTGTVSTVASFIFFFVYAAQFSRANPALPVVNFLVILLAVRLVNEKSARNHLQVFALSLFCLASSSLFSLSIVFVVYLLMLLLLIAVSLVLLTVHGDDGRVAISRAGLRKLLSVALVMPAASVPLLLFFFTILPRTPYPMLNFLNNPAGKVTGFSERVELGKASSVGEVKQVAFRAETEKLAKGVLYWRGIVLNAFDGNSWVRQETEEEEPLPVKGRRVRQTIYPEPGKSGYLVALNVPVRLDGIRTSRSGDFTYVRKDAGVKRVRYEAQSVLGDELGMRRGIDREFYLRPPERVSRRTVELARDIAGRGGSDAQRLALVEEFYRSQRFSYVTKGLPVTADPVDAFLFERRSGHCEFFASSFATLLRLAGVPARLVGGYYGGEYNELGGYYVVTEDMAHVWVEAYIGGRGWVKVDPSSFAVDFAGVGQPARKGAVATVRATFDTLTYYWNQAVITYDLEKQVDLARRANRQLKSLNFSLEIKRILPFLGGLLLLSAVVFTIMRYGSKSPEERLLRRFLARVEKVHGKSIDEPGGGLKDLADGINDPAVDKFVAIYGRAVYRDRKLTGDDLRMLAGLIKIIGQEGAK